MRDIELELEISQLKVKNYLSIIGLYQRLVEIMAIDRQYINSSEFKHLYEVIKFALIDSGLKKGS